jgi:two-component system chemotaxis sensor kinase CheA
VHRNVRALRGRLALSTRDGAGTTFTLRVPLTLAVTDGMLVTVGPERYIVPTPNIVLSFRPERSALATVAGHGEVARLRDALLPIIRLHDRFAIEGAESDPTRALLIVVGAGDQQAALLVDGILGQHQVVARSVGDGIGAVPGIAGSAILGDGRVGLILDIGELFLPVRRAAPPGAAVA